MVSYEVKYRIKERLEKLLKPRYLERTYAINNLYHWADYIYDTIAGTDEFQQTLRSPSPYSYFREIDGLEICTVDGNHISGLFGSQKPLVMPLSTPKLWVDVSPVIGDLKSLIIWELPYGTPKPIISLLEHPKWAEFSKAVAAYNKQHKEVFERYYTPISHVWRICSHYDTLNEAVAAWPALRFVLPDDMQDQDLSFDGTPKPLPDGVDVGELTVLFTCLKMEV